MFVVTAPDASTCRASTALAAMLHLTTAPAKRYHDPVMCILWLCAMGASLHVHSSKMQALQTACVQHCCL